MNVLSSLDPQLPILPAVITSLGVVILWLVFVLLDYRKSAFRWKGQAQSWFDRYRERDAVATRYEAKDAEEKARDERIWQGVQSTVAEVKRQREWREHRALRGIDHSTYHFAEGEIPSIWARELMEFCGGYERPGE